MAFIALVLPSRSPASSSSPSLFHPHHNHSSSRPVTLNCINLMIMPMPFFYCITFRLLNGSTSTDLVLLDDSWLMRQFNHLVWLLWSFTALCTVIVAHLGTFHSTIIIMEIIRPQPLVTPGQNEPRRRCRDWRLDLCRKLSLKLTTTMSSTHSLRLQLNIHVYLIYSNWGSVSRNSVGGVLRNGLRLWI